MNIADKYATPDAAAQSNCIPYFIPISQMPYKTAGKRVYKRKTDKAALQMMSSDEFTGQWTYWQGQYYIALYS